tara:strand:- start:3928 stop:4533 length:606 start_codon:yes stop_codon:yes gene_type:complete
MRNFFSLILFSTILVISGCNTANQKSSTHNSSQPAANKVIMGPGYELNLVQIQLLDPKPLKIAWDKPDTNPNVKRLTITSTGPGGAFPFVYEIISSTTPPKGEVLETISNSLDGKEGIILKTIKSNQKIGKHLHYYHRQNKNGKPHRVSSNYLFVKNNIFYHVSGTSYGAAAFAKQEWGAPKPDGNAEAAASEVLKNIKFK